MDSLEWINIIFAAAGMVLFLYCIIQVRNILQLFPNAKMNKSWKIVNILIAFFLVGYLINIIAVFLQLVPVLLFMQSFVYLFGALFVLIVVRLSYRTFRILKQTAADGET